MNTFKEIFSKYDTDKTENFSDAYEECLTPIRNNIKLIFEIGVNRGGSTKAWKEFFPNALIVGIDINPECHFEEDRIKIEIGNGADPQFINSLLYRYGRPDIVIDDGSHFSSDIKSSFNFLYKHTRYCYIIEDLGTQFHSFGNGFYINDNEPATNMIHHVTDQLLSGQSSEYSSLKIYYSICFIFKRSI